MAESKYNWTGEAEDYVGDTGRGLPSPTGDSPPNAPEQIKKLAEKVDDALGNIDPSGGAGYVKNVRRSADIDQYWGTSGYAAHVIHVADDGVSPAGGLYHGGSYGVEIHSGGKRDVSTND